MDAPVRVFPQRINACANGGAYARSDLRTRFEIVTIHRLTFVFVILTLAGCEFAQEGVHPRQVGASTIINGVEVWTGGGPGRPYRIIATVQKQGADNSSTYLDQEAFIASDAAKRGADAVVVLDSTRVVSRTDVVTGRPIMAPKVEAQLIKYQ